MSKFFGVVRKNCITNGGLKYAVIEIKNSHHLNYTLFIPGEGYIPGQPVEVTVTVADVANRPTEPKSEKIERKRVKRPKQNEPVVKSTAAVAA